MIICLFQLAEVDPDSTGHSNEFKAEFALIFHERDIQHCCFDFKPYTLR